MTVISLAGHDIGRLYIVVKTDGDYVYVSDGREHRLLKPKKKNKKHIGLIFDEKCFDPSEMTDGALRKLLSTLTDEHERIIN
jgi:hypothetical protein